MYRNLSHQSSLLLICYSIFLVLLLSTYSLATSSTQDTLQVTLSKSSRIHVKSGLWITVTLANISDETLHVLRWRTPLTQHIGSDMFVVKYDGQRVPYIGPLIKRRVPGQQDYLEMQPGERATADIDISKLYDLSLKGNYTLQYKLSTLYILETRKTKNSTNKQQKAQPQLIHSNVLETELTSPIVRGKRAKASDFSGCTYSQRAVLNQALSASREITIKAWDDLNNTYENTPNQLQRAARYREWFGMYDEYRYLTVTINIGEIYLALDYDSFVCGGPRCDSGDFAYVFPSLPYEIHVCNEFWNAPLRGTDSQAGTIVHETSHFNVVAGTQDWGYGQEVCRNFADTWPPYHAITNADNYEYFAENNPFLPMSVNITPILSMLLGSSPGKSCGSGMVYDCSNNCVSEATAQSWIGDGYCDDGTYYIPDIFCSAFQFDGGDCN